MATVDEAIEVLEQLSLKRIALQTLEKNEDVIANLNAAQLAQGKRSTGKEILPEYTALTVEIKKGKSGLSGVTDRVTLHDEGDYYRSLYAEVKGEEVEQGSKDWKDEKIRKKYGETIHGLTEESQEELVRQHLRGDFYEQFHEETGL